MYYKEEVIDGILMYRTEPGGNWYPVSKETLTRRLKEAEKNLGRTQNELQSVNEENVQLLAANQDLKEENHTLRGKNIWLNAENKRLTEELSAYKVQMEAIAQKVDLLHAVALNSFGPVQGECIFIIG